MLSPTVSGAPRVSKRWARPLLLIVLLCAIAGTVNLLHDLSRSRQTTTSSAVGVSDNDTVSTPNNTTTDPNPLYNSITIITTIDGDWDIKKEDQVRLLAGSLHRYRPANRAAPRLVVFCEKMPVVSFVEEVEAWEQVRLRLAATALGLPITDENGPSPFGNDNTRRALIRRVLVEHGGPVAWVKAGLIYDPIPNAVKEAMGKPGTIGNPPAIIRPVYKRARHFLIELARRTMEEGVVEGWSESGKEVWVESYAEENIVKTRLHAHLYKQPNDLTIQQYKARDFGFIPKPPYTDAACYVDIRSDFVDGAVLTGEVDGEDEEALDGSKTHLVIGIPLTSKGAAPDDLPVLLSALLPSLLKTVTEEEWSLFSISLYIAFDHGDPVWDDTEKRHSLRQQIITVTENKLLKVKMFRMVRAKRVAMLWSVLYGKAIASGAHYFFQVNDDLTLETTGWLTRYTGQLRANNDFGVAGPFDPHNGINCAVLTQAMVGRLHHRIFKSLYPVEMRDWKTDRWLTHVYNDDTSSGYGNNTWCSVEFVARNGGAKTRYKHCEFLSWQLYVEEGRDMIREFLRNNPIGQ